MRASDFSPPPRRPHPAWVRFGSYALLYGLGVPLVKTLETFGRWPSPSLAKGIRARTAKAFGDYAPTHNDVIVCSFFKSGTTWLLQMTTQIAYRGQAEFENIHHAVPWPDVPMPAMARLMIPLADPSPVANSPTRLRVIKTHLPRATVPFVPRARYVACVRDPKDVCVSGYHFMKALIYGPLAPSVEHWAKTMFSDRSPPYPWAEHLAGYWAVRNEPNVLFLTYEGMRKDSSGTVRKLADFMGVELTADELRSVIHQSSFEEMRRAGGKFEPGQIVPWTQARAMMRAGKSGGSSELLTPAQQRFIDDWCRTELARLNCDFPYDEAFGTVR